jgi:small subunit ribosomal protein S1
MTERDDKLESGEENSFAALFEQSINAKDDFEPGDKVTGTIVGITKDSIFVDISGKSEAIISAGEFRNPDGTISVKAKDTISAYVVAIGAAGIELTSCIGKGAVNPVILKIAKENKIPVTGAVSAKVNGGFSVQIDGLRAFCPLSQIDRKFSGTDSDYIGKSFPFIVTELRGRDIVVSRRELIAAVQQESEDKLRSILKEGEIRDAVVTRIAEFGVFADFGGIEGLIPRFELGRSRLLTPQEFTAGQKIKVKIMSIDWEAKKFSLSIKETEADPWSKLTVRTGDEIEGTVTNMIKSGAFVQIQSGLEGFIHVSKMSYTKRISKPEDVLSIGQKVSVKIADIDSEAKRISLELLTGESDPWSGANDGLTGTVQSAIVESARSAGIVARLSNGMEGFAPMRELACGRDADLSKLYPAGKEIRLAVIEVRPSDKKITLSEKEVERIEERSSMNSYMSKEKTADAAENTSLGSQFGNIFTDLKKKIGE